MTVRAAGRAPRSGPLWALCLLAALAVGCGADDTGPDVLAADHRATPFRLGHLPDGGDYELAVAAEGSRLPLWGDDMLGSDEPVLVLGGSGDGGYVVVVSATGYEGYEGGFEQGSASYPGRSGDDVDVDGHRAIYTPAETSSDDDEVLVDLGDGRAVRVTGHDAGRETLLDVAARARVVHGPDGTTIPEVPDPPGGLEVLARADIDLVLAMAEFDVYPPRAAIVPGSSRSFTVGYRSGAGEGAPVLLALSVPGAEADLGAARSIDLHGPTEAEDVDVDGRAGIVFTTSSGAGQDGVRRLVTTASNGSLLVVTSRPPLAVDELVAVAAGIAPVDRETWVEQTERAGFGPGLRPDPGADAVTQGTVAGIGWLLQAVPIGDVGTDFSVDPALPQGPLVVDPCPKTAGPRRPCAVNSRTGADGAVYMAWYRQEGQSPAFLVGVVPGDVVRIRTSTQGPGAEVETVAVPHDPVRAFVIAVEATGSLPGSLEAVHADGTLAPLARP